MMADAYEDRKLVADFIDAYGRKRVPRAPCIFGASQQKMIIPTELLRPIHNFYSLTICSEDQYLLNSSENKVLLP